MDYPVKVPFYYVVLDEATQIKNLSAQRVALSGTPIENRPAELWSLFDFLLRDHLAQLTGVRLSIGYLRTLMRPQDHVYRRPKHDLTNLQDLEAKAAAQEHLEAFKRGACRCLPPRLCGRNDTELASAAACLLDEAWSAEAGTLWVPTPGQPQRYHLFGAYNYVDDTVTYRSVKRKNSESFIAFLEQLLVEQHPDQPVLLVLDNASYHTGAASLAALSLFEQRVWCFWLPPYCSTLNPIELFWRHLKDKVCANKLFPNMTELVDTVEHHLRAQKDLHNAKRFSISKLIQ
jgi:transposase